MNYQEYVWPFYEGELKPSSTISSDPWAGMDIGGCIDQTCCAEGTVYDPSIHQCVLPNDVSSSSTSVTTPTFQSAYSNSVTDSVDSLYNSSVSAVNTGISDISSGATSAYNSASAALSGTETFVGNMDINEALTKHSRRIMRPVATLDYQGYPGISKSFINYN
jgi:hypothetical protein